MRSLKTTEKIKSTLKIILIMSKTCKIDVYCIQKLVLSATFTQYIDLRFD